MSKRVLACEIPMIPTRYKQKLRQAQTYALGAQMISDALSLVPQFDELELNFSANRHDKVTPAGEHLVITAGYVKHNLGLSAANDATAFYGPRWELWAYAISRELSATVRSKMRDYGFDLIRDWLSESRTELWLTSSHDCKLYYCETNERLVARYHDA